MAYREKYSFIKKAAKLDVDTDSGYYEFLKIAKKSNLGKERLSYYSNAYEAAGDSGLHALSYRKRMSEETRESALEKINKYLLSAAKKDTANIYSNLDLTEKRSYKDFKESISYTEKKVKSWKNREMIRKLIEGKLHI